MNQNELATALIKQTLYNGRQWSADAALVRGEANIIKAQTVWDNNLIRINFRTNKITLNGKRLRLKKETSSDLKTLVKLFTYKILNLKHVPKNRS